jgi:uncharacterized protein YoaH (UPF0181 family)
MSFPIETIRDLIASGIPREEAVRIARSEFEQQKSNKRISPTRSDDWRGRAWDRR